MPIIWRACQLPNMRLTPKGKWQGSVLSTLIVTCRLPTNGIPLPCACRTLSVTWTGMKKTCYPMWSVPTLPMLRLSKWNSTCPTPLPFNSSLIFLPRYNGKRHRFSAAAMRGSFPRNYGSCIRFTISTMRAMWCISAQISTKSQILTKTPYRSEMQSFRCSARNTAERILRKSSRKIPQTTI